MKLKMTTQQEILAALQLYTTATTETVAKCYPHRSHATVQATMSKMAKAGDIERVWMPTNDGGRRLHWRIKAAGQRTL